MRDFTTSRNNLATSRTWLQVDENYRLNENNNFFMREWFVYEPPYAYNSANGIFGKYANEFYNQYTVRDAWWENKTGPLTTYVGNQIVVWGQSLAFRVGDVVNPQDTTWAFGFANLEQSRIPQWMVHPILNLPEFGPLQSNFLEGVLIPRTQPMWNSCDYADHRYDGECNVNAGTREQRLPRGRWFRTDRPFRRAPRSTCASIQDEPPSRLRLSILCRRYAATGSAAAVQLDHSDAGLQRVLLLHQPWFGEPALQSGAEGFAATLQEFR